MVAGAAVVVGTSLRMPSIVVAFGKALSVVVSSVDRSVGYYCYLSYLWEVGLNYYLTIYSDSTFDIEQCTTFDNNSQQYYSTHHNV